MNCFACVPLVKEEGFASFLYQPVGANALGLEAVHFGSRSSLLAFTLSRIILTAPHISCICTNSKLRILEPGLTGKTARNCFYGPGNGSIANSELFYGQGAIATKGAIVNNRGQDRRASQLCSCFLRRIFSYLVNSSGSPSVQNCQMGVLFPFLAVGEDWRT